MIERRRGGDRQSETRRRRDEALVALAGMIAPGASIRRQAEQVVSRLSRYHPAPHEEAPDRVLMAEITATGLSLPGVDQIRKIIGLSKKPHSIAHGPPQVSEQSGPSWRNQTCPAQTYTLIGGAFRGFPLLSGSPEAFGVVARSVGV